MTTLEIALNNLPFEKLTNLIRHIENGVTIAAGPDSVLDTGLGWILALCQFDTVSANYTQEEVYVAAYKTLRDDVKIPYRDRYSVVTDIEEIGLEKTIDLIKETYKRRKNHE